MSASKRLLLACSTLALFISGCAYDPQMAAQYARDGDPIIGPQLPSPGRLSVYQIEREKIYAQDAKTATVTSGNSVSTKEKTVEPAPLGINPATVDSELALPKQDSTATSAPAMATEPVALPKVEEKIVTDVEPPPAAPAPKPVVAEPAPVEPAATATVAKATATPSASTPVTPAQTVVKAEPIAAPVAPVPAPAPSAPQQQLEPDVVIETKYGKITIELDPEAAPKTVANFIKLVQDGYYNGTTFHRIIPAFMIQGGDPNTKGENRAIHGKGGPDYTLPPEIKLPHKRGSVAMARLPNNVNPEKNSNGSQFYICTADCPFLDGEYTVFGHVVSGMQVADRISAQPRDDKDNPILRIEMKVRLVPRAPSSTPAPAANARN